MTNLTIGTYVKIKEPVFSGSFRNATYEGDRIIAGPIVSESYGSTGQHTFTIQADSISGEQADKYKVGQKIRRKGRNIYPNLLEYRYPEDHANLAVEKQARSDAAKITREKRHLGVMI